MKIIAGFGAVCVVLFFLLSFGGRAIADGTTEPPAQPPNQPPDPSDPNPEPPIEPPVEPPSPGDGGTVPYPGAGNIFDGNFEYSSGHVEGTYIDFGVNETTGVIRDFTVKTTIVEWPGWNYSDVIINGTGSGDPSTGPVPKPPENPNPEPPNVQEPPQPKITYKNITVFTSIEVGRFAPLQAPTVVGGLFLFHAEEVLLMVYDSPFANMFYAATSGATGNNTITFNVADGFNVTTFSDMLIGIKNGSRSDGSEPVPYPEPQPNLPWKEAWIASDELSGSLHVENGNISVEGSVITVTLEKGGYASFSAYTILPMFMTVLGPDVKSEDMYDMKNAIADGQVGAEITIGSGGENSATPPSSGGAPTYNTVRYDTSLELRPKSFDGNRIEIEVSSERTGGRVVMVNVEKTVMSVGNLNDVSVKLDGNPVALTADPAGVLSASGTSARAHLVIGSGGATLLVYVPHFSAHTITLEKTVAASTIRTILVPILGAVAVTAAAFGLIARRRKKTD